MKFTLLAVLSSLLVQGGVSSPRDLLALPRPLTAAEIEAVLSGTRQALASVTLRLVNHRASNGRDPEILMGQAGIPHMIRFTGTSESIATVTGDGIAGGVRILSVPERSVWLIEYTAVSARRCSDAPTTSEMVVEDVLTSTTQAWTATARGRGSRDMGIAPPLEMLKAAASLTSGESRVVGNRSARAIHSPWSRPLNRGAAEPALTGDPAPNPAEFVPMQSLWIDTSSLLPLRWEVSQREAIVGGFDFVYEPLDFQRPDGVEMPKCIP